MCAFLLPHSECALIIPFSCYFSLAQAKLISDNGNQEKNVNHLMETHFLGNLTLLANSAVSPAYKAYIQHVFTELPGLLRNGGAILTEGSPSC